MVQRQASTAAATSIDMIELLETSLNSVIRGKPEVVRMALLSEVSNSSIMSIDVAPAVLACH